MKMLNLLYMISLLFITIGCSRKSVPTIIYQDKISTHFDTVTVQTKVTDTVPCDDFSKEFNNGHDTVYVKVIDSKMTVKYITKRDTVFRETIIVQPAPLRTVTKIDNSIHNKAKNGSAVGDGNTITTKKTNWWWIFLAGLLTWCLIQNIGFRILKTYFPFLKFLP